MATGHPSRRLTRPPAGLADQIEVAAAALEQIPAERAQEIEVLLRCDSAAATHELLDWAHEAKIRFSVGLDLTEPVREAILSLPDDAWIAARDQDGSVRGNGEVAEITVLLDLEAWPCGSRVIVHRERPQPGAQLSFTDHDGHRFQAILTYQDDSDIAAIERRHRARARVEDQIGDAKDTGLAKVPFRDFAMNAVWLELVLIAHDLARVDEGAPGQRRARPLAAEAASPSPPARRRPARLLWSPSQASTAGELALGDRASGDVREAQGVAVALGLSRRAPSAS